MGENIRQKCLIMLTGLVDVLRAIPQSGCTHVWSGLRRTEETGDEKQKLVGRDR